MLNFGCPKPIFFFLNVVLDVYKAHFSPHFFNAKSTPELCILPTYIYIFLMLFHRKLWFMIMYICGCNIWLNSICLCNFCNNWCIKIKIIKFHQILVCYYYYCSNLIVIIWKISVMLCRPDDLSNYTCTYAQHLLMKKIFAN